MKHLLVGLALGVAVFLGLSAFGGAYSSFSATPSHAAQLALTPCPPPVLPTPTATPAYGTQPKGTSYVLGPGSQAATPNIKTGCSPPPPSGVPGVNLCGLKFFGTAAQYSVITCVRIPLLFAPCPSQTAFALRITGTDLNIRVPGFQIFWFNPATGKVVPVSAITGSGGQYEFVSGRCRIINLPPTGGGAPSSTPSAPVLSWWMLALALAALGLSGVGLLGARRAGGLWRL